MTDSEKIDKIFVITKRILDEIDKILIRLDTVENKKKVEDGKF